MEEKLENIWNELTINLIKKWITENSNEMPFNICTTKYVIIKPSIDVDVHISYAIRRKEEILDYLSEDIDYNDFLFRNINSFNDTGTNYVPLVVTGTVNIGEDTYNTYVRNMLFKAGKPVVLPKAEFMDFMPGTVEILAEADIPDFPERDKAYAFVGAVVQDVFGDLAKKEATVQSAKFVNDLWFNEYESVNF